MSVAARQWKAVSKLLGHARSWLGRRHRQQRIARPKTLPASLGGSTAISQQQAAAAMRQQQATTGMQTAGRKTKRAPKAMPGMQAAGNHHRGRQARITEILTSPTAGLNCIAGSPRTSSVAVTTNTDSPRRGFNRE
eukprot:IDg8085t1